MAVREITHEHPYASIDSMRPANDLSGPTLVRTGTKGVEAINLKTGWLAYTLSHGEDSRNRLPQWFRSCQIRGFERVVVIENDVFMETKLLSEAGGSFISPTQAALDRWKATGEIRDYQPFQDGDSIGYRIFLPPLGKELFKDHNGTSTKIAAISTLTAGAIALEAPTVDTINRSEGMLFDKAGKPQQLDIDGLYKSNKEVFNTKGAHPNENACRAVGFFLSLALQAKSEKVYITHLPEGYNTMISFLNDARGKGKILNYRYAIPTHVFEIDLPVQ